MKRSIILLIVGVICSNVGRAQVAGSLGYYNDALLLSRTYLGGTARMQGIGGAQMSLGGEVSNGNANPAGLGSFTRSAFAFTPSLDLSSTEATYQGRLTEDFNNRFNIGHLGIVFHMEAMDSSSDYKGGSFSISMTRTNNFYNNIYLDAYNNNSSIIDAYLDRAWGIAPNQLPGDLSDAYNHYLINPYLDDQDIVNYESFVTGLPRQVEHTRTSGKQNQWDFSYGGNYKDMVYFGISAGISNVDYKQESTYTESEFEDAGVSDPALDYVSTQNVLRITGLGVNSTIGVIVRPLDALRIGVSVRTPTFYNLKDESSEDLLTQYNNYAFEQGDSTIVLDEFYDEYLTFSQYRLRTPWKLSFGSSFFLGKVGFISADIDYLNYSDAKITSSDFSAVEENQSVRELYQPTINYRVGAEFRAGVMRFRAGYGHQGDPYVSSSIDNSIKRISGGIGYRNQNMFADLAIVHSKYKSSRTPYVFYDGTGPTADIVNKNVNVSLTVGFNF